MYHLPVMKSETPTVIWVINGSSADSPGVSAAISSKMPTKTGTMNATTAAITRIASVKHDRRVHHRRAHLAAERVEPLELVGDAVERLLEAAGALARLAPSSGRADRRRRAATPSPAATELPASTSWRSATIAFFSISSSVWSSSV